jgi:hypothetical protein
MESFCVILALIGLDDQACFVVHPLGVMRQGRERHALLRDFVKRDTSGGVLLAGG